MDVVFVLFVYKIREQNTYLEVIDKSNWSSAVLIRAFKKKNIQY